MLKCCAFEMVGNVWSAEAWGWLNLRLVLEDWMGWWEMCRVQRVLVKTNMEKVRYAQKKWTKALVSESLTNKTCFRVCISSITQFICLVISIFVRWNDFHLLSRGEVAALGCIFYFWGLPLNSIASFQLTLQLDECLGLSGPRRVSTILK